MKNKTKKEQAFHSLGMIMVIIAIVLGFYSIPGYLLLYFSDLAREIYLSFFPHISKEVLLVVNITSFLAEIILILWTFAIGLTLIRTKSFYKLMPHFLSIFIGVKVVFLLIEIILLGNPLHMTLGEVLFLIAISYARFADHKWSFLIREQPTR